MLCAENWPSGIFVTIVMIAVTSLIAFIIHSFRTRNVKQGLDTRAKQGGSGVSVGASGASVVMIAGLLVVGILYGGFREYMTPHIPHDDWLGKRAVFEGKITQVYQNPGSTAVYLVVHRIEFEDNREQVAIRAYLRVSGQAEPLTPGEDIRVSGILGFRPAQSTQTAIPLQAPTYAITGKLQSVRRGQPWLVRIRDEWLQNGAASARVTPAHQQLAASIVFGADNLSETVKAAFLAAGLMHVLAASGANIVLLELTLEYTAYPIWRRLRLPFWMWSLFLIVIIWVFAGMCAFQVSIVRAAIMATYRWFGAAVGRRSSVSMSLAAAALIMAVTAPSSMLTPSAWLSFMATGAIAQSLLKVNPVRQKVRMPVLVTDKEPPSSGRKVNLWTALQGLGWLTQKGLMSLWGSLRITLSVELVVTPLVLVLFSQITPYSVLANVLCEPLIALLLPLSLLWLSLSAMTSMMGFISLAANSVGFLENELVGGLEHIVEGIAAWPGALWTVRGVPGWWVLLYYLLLTIVKWGIRNWREFGFRQHVS